MIGDVSIFLHVISWIRNLCAKHYAITPFINQGLCIILYTLNYTLISTPTRFGIY